MLTVKKDFLGVAFFIYGFAYQVISEKTLCSKILPAIKETFYFKISVTIIPINLVTNSHLFLFCSKSKNKIFGKFVAW